jgi:hypothetical protein
VALASALLELARQPALRRKLAVTAMDAVRGRTWQRSLERLADGYRRALGVPAPAEERRAA